VPRKSLAVVVAVALAVVASAVADAGLHSAQKNADKNASLTSVYVLEGAVPRNESAAAAYLQGLITTKRLPVQFVPAGAVTNLSLIRNHEAEYNLPAGQVVVDTMFVAPQAGSSLAAQTVPKGDVAVSVSVDQVHGVAGLIQPGDKVDILVDLDSDLETYLYQLVPVLAVGSTLVPASHKRTTSVSSSTTVPGNANTQTATVNPENSKVIITFAVPPAAATSIALAANGGGGAAGGIYLALVASDDAAVSATTISGSNLITGSLITGSPAGSVTNPAPTIVSTGGHVTHSDTNENTP
jgi:pilus assembly protein CpaB